MVGKRTLYIFPFKKNLVFLKKRRGGYPSLTSQWNMYAMDFVMGFEKLQPIQVFAKVKFSSENASRTFFTLDFVRLTWKKHQTDIRKNEIRISDFRTKCISNKQPQPLYNNILKKVLFRRQIYKTINYNFKENIHISLTETQLVKKKEFLSERTSPPSETLEIVIQGEEENT